MSNSTAFCYIMLMCREEKPVKTNVYHFNWRECFLWKNMNSKSYFSFGRYGNN